MEDRLREVQLGGDRVTIDGMYEAIRSSIGGLPDAAQRLGGRLWRRLRRPVLIALSSVILVLLLIVLLQSGLGVDSDETITDSHRPEIVGE